MRERSGLSGLRVWINAILSVFLLSYVFFLLSSFFFLLMKSQQKTNEKANE